MKNLSFGEAVKHAQAGKKISREDWNGKNMWVSITEGRVLDLSKNDIWTKNVKDVAVENGGTIETLPYFIMKTVHNKILIGWLATQTDILVTDWYVLDSE